MENAEENAGKREDFNAAAVSSRVCVGPFSRSGLSPPDHPRSASFFTFPERAPFLFTRAIPFLSRLVPQGRGLAPRARERRQGDRRSEKRKITTVNGTVQRNAGRTQRYIAVCRARFVPRSDPLPSSVPRSSLAAPANIYSYDNRYAAAGYLNGAAAPRFGVSRQRLLRDLSSQRSTLPRLCRLISFAASCSEKITKLVGTRRMVTRR